MTDVQAWSAFYEARGLTYFPLYGIQNGQCRCKDGPTCQNPGKHPVFKWKNQPQHAIRPLDNIGVSTNDLVVIDIDTQAPEILDEYPRTFTTATGKGFHLWYRPNPTKTVKSCVGWKPKIDVRAWGGLVVAPPSRHISGAEYRHYRGDTIQPVPGWVLDTLPERNSRKRQSIPKVDHIEDETHELMRPILDTLASDMLNWQGGRNKTLFQLACRTFEMVNGGMLGADAITTLAEAAQQTGLAIEEILKTLDSAQKSV